jgi:hypothetical protein
MVARQRFGMARGRADRPARVPRAVARAADLTLTVRARASLRAHYASRWTNHDMSLYPWGRASALRYERSLLLMQS